MAPKNRIIIDTDPGVDDVLAMLLALSASPEELEVVMLSVTYGNVPLQSCLRNVVALFHVLEKEMAWRAASGWAGGGGFGALKAYKPIVAVGAEHPLEDELLMADYFHGADGLHGVHDAHPDLTPAETWRTLFDKEGGGSSSGDGAVPSFSSYFTPSTTPAHREMLRLLREAPADTITIVAIGPLTNVALAASEDPETFLRVKELVVMGGTVALEGNITPVAEFNCYADAVAAARVYALTSPTPASTMPPPPPPPPPNGSSRAAPALPPYPATLPRPLALTLFPLDITTPHQLRRAHFLGRIAAAEQAGSPLARWCKTFMVGTFDKIDSLVGDAAAAGAAIDEGLSLHDPMCIWYMLLRDDPRWTPVPRPEDLRVETAGQWTSGMLVADRRMRSRPEDDGAADVPGDTMGWLSPRKGNRINRMVGSPGENEFAEYLLTRLFG